MRCEGLCDTKNTTQRGVSTTSTQFLATKHKQLVRYVWLQGSDTCAKWGAKVVTDLLVTLGVTHRSLDRASIGIIQRFDIFNSGVATGHAFKS